MPGYHVPNVNFIPEGPHMGHVLKSGPPEFHNKKDKKGGKFDQVRKVHPMFEAHRYHPGTPAFPGAYGHPMGGYPGYGAPVGYMGYDSHHAPHAGKDQNKKTGRKFDSIQLLGNNNDTNYLDKFMSTPKSSSKDGKHSHHQNSHHQNSHHQNSHHQTLAGSKQRNMSVTSVPNSVPNSERSGGTGGIKNSRSRNSLNLDNVAKTLLTTMRSAASDEEIYESMEIINYRKTLESITTRDQTAKVKKAGHPLFDHLRKERAIKEYVNQVDPSQAHTQSLPRERALSPHGRERCVSPKRGHHGSSNLDRRRSGSHQQIWPTVGPLSKHPAARRSDVHTSDGNSSSGSADEFDYTPRPNHRFSRSAVLNSRGEQRQSNGNHHNQHQHQQQQEDSDDDWAIPRPSFGLGERTRRSGATGVKHQHPHHHQHQRQVSTGESSDSSSKSTGLR